MIEPLTQQHALEIANDWHYEAPYDFYDMKNDLEDYEEMVSPEARGDRYYQVMNDGELYGFFCLERNRSGCCIFAGNFGLYHGKFCTTSHQVIRG